MSNESLAAVRIAEFDRRHGGNPVFFGNWYWYENGANRDADPIGLLAEPPSDDFARLTNILNYHEGRLRIAVERFDNMKQRLLFSASTDRSALDELKAFAKVVTLRNAAVAEAKKNLAATDRAKQIASHRAYDAEQKERVREFKQAVQSITV